MERRGMGQSCSLGAPMWGKDAHRVPQHGAEVLIECPSVGQRRPQSAPARSQFTERPSVG